MKNLPEEKQIDKSEGFVKLYRKIVDTSFYKNHSALALAIHCLLQANWEEKKIIFNTQELILKPGQFITGILKLSKEIHLSIQKTRTLLKILKNVEFLTIKSTNKFSIITVEKYRKYQEREIKITSTLTNQQQTSNKPATTDNNNKNLKELKELAFSSEVLRIDLTTHKAFLKAYPKIDLKAEYNKMNAWLIANPKRQKKDHPRFANNWLAKTQPKQNDNGGLRDYERRPYIP